MTTSATSQNIIVVEDEFELQSAIVKGLQIIGHTAKGFSNPIDALNFIAKMRVDLVVLDVMMPGMDGFGVAEILEKKHPNILVLFVTARGEIPDRLRGLTLGDDYLIKPFSLEELFARVNAIFKRAEKLNKPPNRLLLGAVELDLDLESCEENGTLIPLTQTEYRILKSLIENSGRVVSKTQLLKDCIQEDSDGTNLVETHISKIRGKLLNPSIIQTKRGVGYYVKKA